MQVSEIFLAAKKDKNLERVMVEMWPDRNNGKPQIRLSLKPQYEGGQTQFVSTETTFGIQNYTAGSQVVNKVFFYLYSSDGHVKTFLKAIKATSDVHFRVICFISSEGLRAQGLNWYQHKLIGIVDGNEYLLAAEFCEQTTASAVSS